MFETKRYYALLIVKEMIEIYAESKKMLEKCIEDEDDFHAERMESAIKNLEVGGMFDADLILSYWNDRSVKEMREAYEDVIRLRADQKVYYRNFMRGE